MSKKRVVFYLTDEQMDIVAPLLSKASDAMQDGLRGIVLAQIGQEIDQPNKVSVAFLPHKTARRMVFALDPNKFIRQVQEGLINPDDE